MFEGMKPETMSWTVVEVTSSGTSPGATVMPLPGWISRTSSSPVTMASSIVMTYQKTVFVPMRRSPPLPPARMSTTLSDTENRMIGTISMHRAFMNRVPTQE